ncbi:MAG: hypothetical protein ACM3XZ_03330 [Betaproteobacteria bacterium]
MIKKVVDPADHAGEKDAFQLEETLLEVVDGQVLDPRLVEHGQDRTAWALIPPRKTAAKGPSVHPSVITTVSWDGISSFSRPSRPIVSTAIPSFLADWSGP